MNIFNQGNNNNLESEMIDYNCFNRRQPNRTYSSKRIIQKYPNDSERNIRIVKKVIDCQEGVTHEQLKLTKEIILRTTPKGRQQIIAKIYEDTKGVFSLTIQRFTTKTGVPHGISFCFVGQEIKKLKDFVDSIPFLDFGNEHKTRVEDDEIIKLKREIVDNADIIKEALKNNITKTDIVSLGYRKEQLKDFNKLLNDSNFFIQKKNEWNKRKGEGVWQYFFEKNPWIFGYGLNFSFNEPFNENKLEQIIKGFDVTGRGKRVDALLKTRGVINSICLVEIKRSDTNLLKPIKNAYRSECWQLSDELNGGIVQSQKNSQKTIESVGTKFEKKKKDGEPTGEIIFSYLPKSYLIIGNLKQFETEKGINEEKFSSFELYRKNMLNPEIITFDELFERAKFIVETNKRRAE